MLEGVDILWSYVLEKPENPEKTTNLEQAITTLPHADVWNPRADPGFLDWGFEFAKAQ